MRSELVFLLCWTLAAVVFMGNVTGLMVLLGAPLPWALVTATVALAVWGRWLDRRGV